MKQVLVRGGKVEVAEVPAPAPDRFRALVATACSVISSGTETAVLGESGRSALERAVRHPSPLARAAQVVREEGLTGVLRRLGVGAAPAPGLELGYAASGVIVERGEGIELAVGTRVACAGSQFAHHAELISVPANLMARIPDSVALEEAAFATLGAIALHGFHRSEAGLGESVGVVGLGLVGLLGAQIARAAGCTVLAYDPDSSRVALARDLGIHLARELGESDPEAEAISATAGMGLDAVLVFAASASNDPLTLALKLCRKKGRVVVVGDVKMEVDRPLLYGKEIDLLISTSYGPGRYDPAYEEGGRDYPYSYVRWTQGRNLAAVLEMMAAGSLRVRPLIERIHPISEAEQAYASLAIPSRRPAVLLSYSGPGSASPPGTAAGLPAAESRTLRLHRAQGAPGEVRAAVVGPGSFMREVFLPAFRRQPGTRLVAVVAGTGGGARASADRFGAEVASTDLDAVLGDPAVHLVLIGTRHHLHAEQVVRSLQSGKAVFVEKPLCLSREELERIRAARQDSGRLLAVGFNRRYAPLVRRMKQRLALLSGPRVVLIRVNALRLPKEHWAQDPAVGGGRLVGEGCHFIDLIPFLAGSSIVSLQVESVPPYPGGAPSSDNFAVSVRMADGSLGSLSYSSLGDSSLPKERIEVHAGAVSLVLDDFRSLALHAGGKVRKLSGPQDKGIEAEAEALVRAVKGEESDLVSWEEAEAATSWTLRARDLMEGRE
jgi:predicted dehydrogenase/threonine dehydrogenase-like Zn-dependent dehydrogenase